MSSPLLTFLKYIFLAALYLFFLRVLRAVWIETREPKLTAADAAAADAPRTTVDAEPAHPLPFADGAASGDLVEVRPDGIDGRRFPVGQEVSVGRSPGCGVALPEDTFVSQVHARIFRRDGLVWVEDLGSTNGTFINEGRVDAPVPLRVGDTLRVGQTHLELSP